jgi:hypothetical protein
VEEEEAEEREEVEGGGELGFTATSVGSLDDDPAGADEEVAEGKDGLEEDPVDVDAGILLSCGEIAGAGANLEDDVA